MGTCRYCRRRIIRPTATICKKCFDEVFRYEKSVKWFETSQMDKLHYYKELIKIAKAPTIKKHFQLESNGLIDSFELMEGETVLAVIKNVKYIGERIVEGTEKGLFKKNGEDQDWHIQKIRKDTGCLIVTTDRLEFLGRYLKVVKEFSKLEKIEDYDGLGITIPAITEINHENVVLRQYFYPFVDYRYLIHMIGEFSKRN
ncbi:MAG: hypothetical protein PHR60_02445 [Eubacteriales bacterium]|nr:hypothetical protein [Eubacteriales bacterium]